MSKGILLVPECVLYVCCGSKCKKRGGKDLFKKLKHVAKERSLKQKIRIIKTGCTDNCKIGPIISVMPHNEWHIQMDEKRTMALLDRLSNKA